MNLTQAELDYIALKHERNERLTLEEVLMYEYKRPCRRVFPHSDDPVITLLKAARGSVIIKEEEVLVVCNPLDFHLLAPSPGFCYTFSDPSELLSGTTIVRVDPKGKVDVEYVFGGEDNHYRTLGLAVARWGGEMLGNRRDLTTLAMLFTKPSYKIPGGHTRILTCLEEVCLLAYFSAKRILNNLPDKQFSEV